jgi:predicted ABC-type transport system involved in lysophospholipase L1 biosynthesis ATPase subunit
LSASKDETPLVRLTDGLSFAAGPQVWRIDPLRIRLGQWIALVPGGTDPAVDPAGPLARILATLMEPMRGTLEIDGQDVYRLPYRDVQRLRANLGFVQGYGGLLSNRTIRDNVALPLSVHGKLSVHEEERRVQGFLSVFALEQVADLRPHDVDGGTRWRACLARSLILSPRWVVMEGIGDWEMDRGRGVAWGRFGEYRARGGSAGAICLSRNNPEFEAWFEEEGGTVVTYTTREGTSPPRSEQV